jgi:hypothetical protein
MRFMKITIENSVLDYLNKKECDELTIDVVELDVSCCIGRIPETRIDLCSPSYHQKYNSYTVEGIKINLSKTMRFEEELKIVLSGFWFFRHLGLVGNKVIL